MENGVRLDSDNPPIQASPKQQDASGVLAKFVLNGTETNIEVADVWWELVKDLQRTGVSMFRSLDPKARAQVILAKQMGTCCLCVRDLLLESVGVRHLTTTVLGRIGWTEPPDPVVNIISRPPETHTLLGPPGGSGHPSLASSVVAKWRPVNQICFLSGVGHVSFVSCVVSHAYRMCCSSR